MRDPDATLLEFLRDPESTGPSAPARQGPPPPATLARHGRGGPGLTVRSPGSAPGAAAVRYDPALAVVVPAMSWPHHGVADSGTKPLVSAFITHVHSLAGSVPKLVA